MKRFATISFVFCLGLGGLAFALDAALGWFAVRTEGKHLIGREVYVAQEIARRRDPGVHTLFLGDSVARQIFPPGEEEDRSVKYITTNQAISVAGQYYLLAEALATHSTVKRVYLFYTPSGWANNLDQVYTKDYFCGYFHKSGHIRGAFEVTRDWGLLAAHIGRALFPNLAAANSSMTLSRSQPRQGWAPPARPDAAITVSLVSEKFLAKIREYCAARGIEFHVYPCPVSDQFSFRHDGNLYDAPIPYLPRQIFHDDAIHLKGQYVAGVRADLVARLPSVAAAEESSAEMNGAGALPGG